MTGIFLELLKKKGLFKHYAYLTAQLRNNLNYFEVKPLALQVQTFYIWSAINKDREYIKLSRLSLKN